MTEFKTEEELIKKAGKVCLICNKEFKQPLTFEEIVLIPLQVPKGDFFIDSVCVPIHISCHFIDNDEYES